MIVGFAPFSSDSNDEIYYKIQKFEDYLHFPPEINISYEVVDLISHLLTDPQFRLGKNGAEEIKKHAWFHDIDWKNIKSMTPPFVPSLQSQIDTKYFDHYDEEDTWVFEGEETYKKDFNFIGYTYKLQNQASKNIMKEELSKIQKLKKQERQREKELAQANMKKKKENKIIVIGQNFHDHKNVFQKINLCDNIKDRVEIMTERNKLRKSKSPLQIKDTNRVKTKQSLSKSPIKLESRNN